jgi:MutS-like protein
MKKVARGTARLQDLGHVYTTIRERLPELIESTCELLPLVSSFFSSLQTDMRGILDMMDQMIDWEHQKQTREWLINPSFDQDLRAIAAQRRALVNQIEDEHLAVCKQLSLEAGKKCKLEHSPVYGYHLRISRLVNSVIDFLPSLLPSCIPHL